MKLVENKFSIWYISNVRYVNNNDIEKKITISSNGKIEKSIDELPKDLKYEILEVFSNIDNANEKNWIDKNKVEEIKKHIRQMLKQLQKTKRCDIK